MSTQIPQAQERPLIAVEPNDINKVAFYISDHLLSRAAADHDAKVAAFLPFAVPEVIKTLADLLLPGFSPLFRFHREERDQCPHQLHITVYEDAVISTADIERLQHILEDLAEASISYAIKLMEESVEGGR